MHWPACIKMDIKPPALDMSKYNLILCLICTSKQYFHYSKIWDTLEYFIIAVLIIFSTQVFFLFQVMLVGYDKKFSDTTFLAFSNIQ